MCKCALSRMFFKITHKKKVHILLFVFWFTLASVYMPYTQIIVKFMLTFVRGHNRNNPQIDTFLCHTGNSIYHAKLWVSIVVRYVFIHTHTHTHIVIGLQFHGARHCTFWDHSYDIMVFLLLRKFFLQITVKKLICLKLLCHVGI